MGTHGTPAAIRAMRWMTDDGVALAGDAGGDGGATVVLMHGGGQTRHSWSGAMDALLAAGYAVINYDARGHGESDWDPRADYSLRRRAADLSTVLAGVAGDVALVGASMGGATAMQFVAEGELPAALVLVDIVPRPDRRGVERIRRFMQGNPQGFATLDEVADAIAAYNPHRRRPSDLDGLRRNLRRRADGRYYWHWDPKILAPNPDQDLRQFERALDGLRKAASLPVQLIRGTESDVVGASGVAELQQALPGLEIHDVAGAGHMVAGDRNDAFNSGVLGFLRRHLSAPAEHSHIHNQTARQV
jgi:pimeloyl-ACP methyl ester carboxylesterase